MPARLRSLFTAAAFSLCAATSAAADARLTATFESILRLGASDAVTNPDMAVLGRDTVRAIAAQSATDSLRLSAQEDRQLARADIGGIVSIFNSVTTRAAPAEAQNASVKAIKAMVRRIDNFSTYYTDQEYETVRRMSSGTVAGIGVELDKINGRTGISGIVEGSPAAAAPLQAGDIINTIDDIPSDKLDPESAGNLIRGVPGTRVALQIERNGHPQSVTVTRAQFRRSAVESRMIGDDIAYVRLSIFSKGAAKDVENAIKAQQRQAGDRLRGLILDLRGNPGGHLDESHALADMFLNGGMTVSKGATPRAAIPMHAGPGDILNGLPLYVLTSPTSKSGAELVAAALQDHGRATIVGTQTRGKGSVQGIYNLTRRGGSGTLHLTNAYYFTPRGKSVHNTGVFPDIEYRDPAIQRLAAELRRNNPPDRMPSFPHTDARVTKHVCMPAGARDEDYHLACAIESIRAARSLTRLTPR